MELVDHRCKRCGGVLIKQSELVWKCKYCGTVFDDETEARNTQTLNELLDKEKQEMIANLRKNLYDAVHAEYISTNQVLRWSEEIKRLLPDDFAANFFEVAASDNVRRIASYIREIDTDEHYDEMDLVIEFLIRSLQSEYLLDLNNLIDRTYKRKNLSLFEKYATALSIEAEKVQNGVYETLLPRDVFIAYSAKDMDFVSALVEVLEAQRIKCFVSARNLRHGKGSVENYDQALKEAMDNCKTFVFVSSTNSRSLSCDALKIELPYIKSCDIANAPPEYRNNYITIPHAYKKPRVEYRINESPRYNVADEIVKEFFDGYEWALSCEEVAKRVAEQLIASNTAKSRRKEEPAAPRIPKYDQGHVHSYTSKTVEPSCISKGYTVHTCACGDQYTDSYTPLAEHRFTDWALTHRSTCEKSGEEQRRCTVCGTEEKREIPATGHDFGPWQQRGQDPQNADEIRICRNCGFEDVRSHSIQVEKKSKKAKKWVAFFWLCFCAFLVRVLFFYDNGSLFDQIKECNPLGLALAQDSSKLSFAMIAMTVCWGLAYLLCLLITWAGETPAKGKQKRFLVTLGMIALWYGEYGLCRLLLHIKGGFYIWSIVIAFLLNFIVFVIFAVMDDKKYLNDPVYSDDNEKALYMKWRRTRAWLIFSSVLTGASISLIASSDDSIELLDQVIILLVLAVGAILTVANFFRNIAHSHNRGFSKDIKKQISKDSLYSAFFMLVLAIAAFALLIAFSDVALVENLAIPALLITPVVSLSCFISALMARSRK